MFEPKIRTRNLSTLSNVTTTRPWHHPVTHMYQLSQYSVLLLFFYFFFIHFIIHFRQFGPPYLGKTTAAARASLPSPTSACGVFSCFHNPPNSDTDYRIFNMRMWSFLGVRAYTGGWAHRQRVSPTFLTQKNSHKFFLVLLVGFEPLGLWISSLMLYQQCNPTTLTCGESWKGTEAKREGEEHIAWTQDSNPKSLYPVKCHHHSPMTPPGHTHVPVITTFALSLLKLQECKTVNAGRSHSQTHETYQLTLCELVSVPVRYWHGCFWCDDLRRRS